MLTSSALPWLALVFQCACAAVIPHNTTAESSVSIKVPGSYCLDALDPGLGSAISNSTIKRLTVERPIWSSPYSSSTQFVRSPAFTLVDVNYVFTLCWAGDIPAIVHQYSKAAWAPAETTGWQQQTISGSGGDRSGEAHYYGGINKSFMWDMEVGEGTEGGEGRISLYRTPWPVADPGIVEEVARAR